MQQSATERRARETARVKTARNGYIPATTVGLGAAGLGLDSARVDVQAVARKINSTLAKLSNSMPERAIIGDGFKNDLPPLDWFFFLYRAQC